MVRELALPIEIVPGETIRAADGLALSSRNGYPAPPSGPRHGSTASWCGSASVCRPAKRDYLRLETEAMAELAAHGWHPDYVTVRRRSDLQAPSGDEALVVLAAARARHHPSHRQPRDLKPQKTPAAKRAFLRGSPERRGATSTVSGGDHQRFGAGITTPDLAEASAIAMHWRMSSTR